MRQTRNGNMDRRFREINQFIERLPEKMHERFVEETPIRTGNAKRRTQLRGNDIEANYPYAVRLEGAEGQLGSRQGYSRQAPGGMAQPTIDFAQAEFRKLR